MSAKKLDLEGKSVPLSTMAELISKMLVGAFVEQAAGTLSRREALAVSDGMAMVLAACYSHVVLDASDEVLVEAKKHIAELAEGMVADLSQALNNKDGAS